MSLCLKAQLQICNKLFKTKRFYRRRKKDRKKTMVITQNSFISSYTLSPTYLLRRNVNGKNRPQSSKKKHLRIQNLNKNNQEKEAATLPPLRVSNVFLARSAVAVLGLGFIDAGYSGDWSRIGVISKGTEEFLKIAAFVVVPCCIFLILSFTKKET